ncbi:MULTISPECIES: NAD(P)-dependent oxidoreductase [unclassified Sphingomonas]|uniref:NAD(P)-dependent oxidoreductase n=1 Tax=unclassified Sphingomonas TaxID=196159 RepID=UPI0006F53AE6|nr:MULTISPECIES: NAD(P)H-binding protein [unclassified Sphingomonas]KQX19102.1 3-beta hydroxysteroid dehydrogenase [Sphingomonas sp. Root1294]KQY65303.1 3-beta hydroxysteroid dehydrogenase [Sphingomonas sp. Root50]KRB95402.1 3-beta hydroxysteroid dehydrogenase [Sphingomonas sp. Root720]
MQIALIGATGNVGSAIAKELVGRGHRVTAIARNVSGLTESEAIQPTAGDMTNPDELAAVLAGHDAVISSAAFTPGTSAGLIEAVRRSDVKRFIVVGGAGSLNVAPGKRLIDVLEAPADAMVRIGEGVELLAKLRGSPDLEWTFFSPPAQIGPGERTGIFRLGKDDLIADSSGKSAISYDDYAIALVDELERPANVRARFTIGY